ncbi:MAG: hypothetical protein WCG23_01785 [bacterium]
MAETALNLKYSPSQTKEITLVKNSTDVSENNAMNIILHSNVLNFVIVVILIVWLIKKAKISELLAKKQQEIAELIKNAAEEKKIKQNQLLVTKTKVSNVEQEVQKIVVEGEQIAGNLSESIISDAQKQAEDMHNKAVISVGNEKQLVSRDVIEKITGAAFFIAEEHIKNSIDDRLHKKYINEFIEDLDAVQN